MRFLAMTMFERAQCCSFGLTKMFFPVPRKVRFLAMTMFEQAQCCSFGLTKTLITRKRLANRTDAMWKSSWLLIFLQIAKSLFSLCSKIKISIRSCTKFLDKDTIKPETRLHLFVTKRGYTSAGSLAEVVSYTHYKLKTLLQWQITSAFAWCSM